MKSLLSMVMSVLFVAAGIKRRFVDWLLRDHERPRTIEHLASAPLAFREQWANQVLQDVHILNLMFGENTVKLDGTNNRIEYSTTSTTLTAKGQIGMNVTTGEPLWYDTAQKSMVDHGNMVGLTDDDHTIYTKADGTRAFTGAQSMGSFKLTSLASGTATGDAVNKGQLDAAITGLAWQSPASVNGYFANLSIVGINSLTPSAGDSVVATTAGTPTAGTSDALAVGDIAEFNGTSWKKIVTNSGGFPPLNTRAVVSTTAVLTSPLVDATDDGKVATWDGASLTPTLTSPSDGYAILVNGELSINENKAYTFDGAVPTGTWMQFAGAGLDHGALTGLSDDDHTQYALLAGRSGGQSLIGSTVASQNLTLESTSNSPKGFINIASGSDLKMLGDDDWVPATNNTGKVGTSSLKFSEVNATTVNAGDLTLTDPMKGAAWRIIEEVDHIVVQNDMTGQRYKMVLEAIV